MEQISHRGPKYQSLMFGTNLDSLDIQKGDLFSNNPRPPLSFILRYHAFARAGGEQAGYGSIAFKAINSLQTADHDRIPGVEIWDEFQKICEKRGIGVNERINKGVITGLSELASVKGNLFLWMEKVVKSTGKVRPVFKKLEQVKGVGRKIATFIIRDVIWFMGLEEQIQSSDLKFLHPIDRWVRRVAEQLFPDLRGANRDQIATRLAEKCESHGISNVEFNQGAWYLSRIELDGEVPQLESEIQTGLKNIASV